jgi:hypothetical protein
MTFYFATLSPPRLGFGDALTHLGYLLAQDVGEQLSLGTLAGPGHWKHQRDWVRPVGPVAGIVTKRGCYSGDPVESLTGHPTAARRCLTRSVSSGEGNSSVSLVIATLTSVP